MLLEIYCKMWDFRVIFELKGWKLCKKGNSFVIQKYVVCCLYYDFCFEMDGVLKSWVVMCGFSLIVGEKWLVVYVEDYLLILFQFIEFRIMVELMFLVVVIVQSVLLGCC